MPLSAPVEREHLHTRTYDFQGYRRGDGLWDIEGRIVDRKAYDVQNEEFGLLEAGHPMHDMSVRLTLDDAMTVRAVEVSTDASPYSLCPAIIPNFQRLVGLKVGAGWRQAVRAQVGGVAGCTHIVEMLMAIGTPAIQAIAPVLSRERAARGESSGGLWGRLINSCHAHAVDSPVTRRFRPQYANKQQG